MDGSYLLASCRSGKRYGLLTVEGGAVQASKEGVTQVVRASRRIPRPRRFLESVLRSAGGRAGSESFLVKVQFGYKVFSEYW